MADKKWYSLDEAAAKLGVSTDEVNKLAQRGELRRVQAGQAWQFRAQDVDELARTSLADEAGIDAGPLDLGGPDPAGEHDIVFDFQQPGSGRTKRDTPSSGKLPRVSPEHADEYDALGELPEAPGGSKSKIKRKTGLEPVARTDSSVRLVPLPSDSSGENPLALGPLGPTTPAGSSGPGSRPDLPETVSLPPLDLDDLAGPDAGGSGKHAGPKSSGRLSAVRPDSTGELNLGDLDDLQGPGSGSASKPKPKTKVQAPKHTTAESPFELSEADLGTSELGGPPAPRSNAPKSKSKMPKPAFEISADDEVDLGGMPAGGLGAASGSSGINLQSPADSGISLEKADHGAEFELSLDESSDPGEGSSEFELTLDDVGGLAPLEEPKATSSDAEKDIFETDFDMPALEEESGFEPVAIQDSDSDASSSDFDLSLSSDSGDSGELDDSASHVVALGEEEEQSDESAKTIVRRRKSKIHLEEEEENVSGSLADDESGFEGLEDTDTDTDDEEDEDEEEGATRTVAVHAPPASWGYVVPVTMFFCTAFMFLVGLMSFEMLHAMWSYKQNYPVTATIVQGLANTFVNEPTGPKK